MRKKVFVGLFGEYELEKKTAEELSYMDIVHMGYKDVDGERIYIYMGLNDLYGQGYYCLEEVTRHDM